MTLADYYDERCRIHSDISGHLPYLRDRAAKADVLIELGVRGGNSTAAFLFGIEGRDAHLWSVDIEAPGVPGEWWFGDTGSQWSCIIGDDTSEEVQNSLPQACDLLFIDTSHRYQHTLAELNLYGTRVRSGGVILLHDVDLEKAPAGVGVDDENFPVRRAVEDWCRRQLLTPEYREGFYGLGVIEVV